MAEEIIQIPDTGFKIPKKEGTVQLQIWPSARDRLKEYRKTHGFKNMSEALNDALDIADQTKQDD